MDIPEKKKNNEVIAVIGVGYVGVRHVLNFAKADFEVIGFDTNRDRLAYLKNSVLSTPYKILYTNDPTNLNKADYIIVCVPTPVDYFDKPDLNPLYFATNTIRENMKKGTIIIYESTVFPTCIELNMIPMIEKVGYVLNKDFFVGYSPERFNPGNDISHQKIVSCNHRETLDKINNLYSHVYNTIQATNIKTAEAVKLLENTQRDVAIAFMNEACKLLDTLGIDTNEVCKLMGTKTNALNIYPGLIGGHCIGIDTYYYLEIAKRKGCDTRLTSTARKINDEMATYVNTKLFEMALIHNLDRKKAKVLVLGMTYKPNVSDVRNSMVFNLLRELSANDFCHIDAYDPFVDFKKLPRDIQESYYTDTIGSGYDVIILAVPHDCFIKMDMINLLAKKSFFIDIYGSSNLKNNRDICYWSL